MAIMEHLGGSVGWVFDFDSAHDLSVLGWSPVSGFALLGKSAGDALSSSAPSTLK